MIPGQLSEAFICTNRPELLKASTVVTPQQQPQRSLTFKAFLHEQDGSTPPAPATSLRSAQSLFEREKTGLCSPPQQIPQTDVICFLSSMITVDDNINLC